MGSPTASQHTLAGFPAYRTGPASDRPPLLFLHGALVGHDSFRPWQDYLAARGWESVAASRRGRAGVGPARAAGLSIADYVDDTLAVVDAIGETPVVIGHSLGALIAQKLAELGKARALVLLSPAPAKALPAQPVAIPAYLPMLPRILTGRPVLPTAKGCATIALNRMPPQSCPVLHGKLVHESGKVYREMIFGSYRVDFGKITCPAMVLSGRDDRIVAPDVAAWTADRLGVAAEIIDGHAHWLLEEAGWERLVERVAVFLDDAVGNVAPLRRAG